MSKIIDGAVDAEAVVPVTDQALARQRAIKQIERRRRFWMNCAVSSMIMLVVVAVWALSEYHNAGGWPTGGFSQSSGIPNVWNMWILYPMLGWALFITADACSTFLRRPISESDIKREIERQSGMRR